MPQDRNASPSTRTHRYDPYADFQTRYPDWRLEVSPRLDAAVEITPAAKMVLIGRHDFLKDPSLVVAHFVALLDEHLHDLGDGSVPEAWEDDADREAAARLGRLSAS